MLNFFVYKCPGVLGCHWMTGICAIEVWLQQLLEVSISATKVKLELLLKSNGRLNES